MYFVRRMSIRTGWRPAGGAYPTGSRPFPFEVPLVASPPNFQRHITKTPPTTLWDFNEGASSGSPCISRQSGALCLRVCDTADGFTRTVLGWVRAYSLQLHANCRRDSCILTAESMSHAMSALAAIIQAARATAHRER